MFKRHLAGVALALVTAAPAASQTADTVVATVNGVDITFGHMIVLRTRLPQEYAQLPADTLFDGILDQLIQQQALIQADRELSLTAQKVLDNERRALLANEALIATSQSTVTDEAILDLYNDTIATVEPEPEFNASHILVETEEEAIAVIALLDGGADFAETAKEKSTGPSGPNGGLLGWFGLGSMVPEFEDAVIALDDGAVSPPVQTQFGWHVVRRNESREKPKPTLEEATAQLREELEGLAVESAVESAMESAVITRADKATLDAGRLVDTTLLD